MTVDVGPLKDKIRERGQQIFDGGLLELQADLDAVVPNSDGSPNPFPSMGPKLKDSRQVFVFTPTSSSFTATITYTAPQANFTNEGTEPHLILPTRARHLRFYWDRMGDIVYRTRVNHPGSHKHDRWFDAAVARWPDALQRAQ